MKKRIMYLLPMFFSVMLLAGCTEYNLPITAESEGIWNRFFVYPLSWLIKEIASLLGGDFGLALIIVTVIVRLVVLPLYVKQIKSTQAMQAVQPEFKKLQEKYKSKDAETQKKLQKEMMALYQEYQINPLMGCLPILIQMPILMGFYHAINRTVEIKEHTFLWFNLGEADPFFILPVIAAVLTFVSQKIMMKGMPPNPQMQMMLYIMPLMILFMGVTLPSALSMYWVVGTSFTIGQTLVFKNPYTKKAKEAADVGGAKK
ncbi:MAG: membrane protein insertase YidC [Bacilli bacterium]